jgi:hypothetical protein
MLAVVAGDRDKLIENAKLLVLRALSRQQKG